MDAHPLVLGRRFITRFLAALLLALVVARLAWAVAASPLATLSLSVDDKQTTGLVSRGPVTAHLSVTPVTDQEIQLLLPQLQVLVHGKPVLHLQAGSTNVKDVLVQIGELDRSNPYPEVVFSSFTGGAHCCNEVHFATSSPDGSTWHQVDVGLFDGVPHEVSDPDHEGVYKFVDVDNRFLYAFSSYAGSAAPPLVYQLYGRQVQDVTRQPRFHPLVYKSLAQYGQAIREVVAERNKVKGDDAPEINGLLAGYVGTASLLGIREQKAAWQVMLKDDDRSSDWGLEACQGDKYDDQGKCTTKEIKYGSFPAALRVFLIEKGYWRA